jgi:hypothetical protein
VPTGTAAVPAYGRAWRALITRKRVDAGAAEALAGTRNATAAAMAAGTHRVKTPTASEAPGERASRAR